MYICRHFKIYELVDKKTFDRFGLHAWMFLNPTALQALDGIRDFFTELRGKDTPVIVNNYHSGGPFQYRGLRPLSCAIGAEYSQHRLGNAFDCDIKGVSAERARQIILEHKDDPRLAMITCIEADVNWLHFDCRNIPDRIRIVHP
jgi:hypothetical protein